MSLTFSEYFCQKISRKSAKIAVCGVLSFSVFLGPSFAFANLPEPSKNLVLPLGLAEFQAYQLLESKKWADAALAYQALLKQDPRSATAWVGLSASWVHLGKRAEAIEALADYLRRIKGPQRKAWLQKVRVFARVFLTSATFQVYQDGLNALSLQNYSVAREKFERALAEEPDNVEILIRLGQALVLAGESESALKYLKQAQKICPLEPHAGIWSARALHLKGKYQEAYAEWNGLGAEMKESEYGPLWFSETLTQLGQPISALHLLENDLRVNPMHLPSLILGARLRLQYGQADKKMMQGLVKNLQQNLKKLEDSRLSNTDNLHEDFDPTDLGVPMPWSRQALLKEIQSLIQKGQDQLKKMVSAPLVPPPLSPASLAPVLRNQR